MYENDNTPALIPAVSNYVPTLSNHCLEMLCWCFYILLFALTCDVGLTPKPVARESRFSRESREKTDTTAVVYIASNQVALRFMNIAATLFSSWYYDERKMGCWS